MKEVISQLDPLNLFEQWTYNEKCDNYNLCTGSESTCNANVDCCCDPTFACTNGKCEFCYPNCRGLPGNKDNNGPEGNGTNLTWLYFCIPCVCCVGAAAVLLVVLKKRRNDAGGRS